MTRFRSIPEQTAFRPTPRTAVRPSVVRAGSRIETMDVLASSNRTLERQAGEASVERLKNRLALEKSLPLQPGTESRLLLQPDPVGKGTVVMLHGWSGGTYQYDDMAKLVYAQGKNVYVPRLEGHGFRRPDGSQDPSHMVKAGERQRYHRFAEQVFDDVRGLGPVQLVGLSGGANVALDIAARHPEVKGVVAMAPLLGIENAQGARAYHVFTALDRLSFGQASQLLDRVSHKWGPTWPGLPGHWEHTLGGMFAVATYGHKVLHDLGNNRVPIQFITSRADTTASRSMIFQAFERAGGSKNNGWYDFENVVHPMVSSHTNPDRQSIDVLTRITLDFLESGKRVGKRPTK